MAEGSRQRWPHRSTPSSNLQQLCFTSAKAVSERTFWNYLETPC
eukprot:UN14885